ncbi:beta-lactamase family protein [Novosphingobium sp. G106]|uniref:serine hydrolase domain-containing protein n=1 Tax=Novosphingobium sp. G106 TaxID=2849500 RepID=UPI001C2DEB26|nr:serine hydrolase domain-containing protein [Novosphingobium sp. G106]MBV1689184.1 beta-lactamase family protein [Novosphingobium sp. G106]
MRAMDSLKAELGRRELLRLGAWAGLSAALMPRLAWAAEQPSLMPQVTALIERWVGPGKFPGMVAALGLPGRETQYVSRGSDSFTDLDAQGPDSLYRIYSMTKPITGMATMMLIGEGKLRLDQPVADILPKFAHMQVQKTYDGSLTDLEPAKSQITIRELITHTSGIGYSIIQRGPIKEAFIKAGLVAGQISHMSIPGLDRGQAVPSLTQFADGLAEMPLVYQPATHWSYSNGLDLMGRVIEVVSGKPFDVFLKERIFDPAGMTSTWFQVPASEAKRLTTNFAAMGANLIPIDPGATSIFLDKPSFPMGGAGLVSSPRDYDRFLLMLANYGQIGGKRIIAEAAVRQGTSNLLPPGVAGPALMAPASDFGAGGRVGVGMEAGIYGWAGAAGTVANVDMKRGIRTGIYVQFMPPNGNSLLKEYSDAIHADVAALLELHA